ncbi:protein D2-like isoform X2 [Cimex lectularius]|uniref:Phosphatidylethanolamine binding protein n=1 Tax=Cimex lectularius TaxID=79782 RepID=A0A8I6RRK9_CIMLE|nr:protein D2-like isoform X2 [Cimex lectularius]
MQVLREYGVVPDVIDRIVGEKVEVNYKQGRAMVELGNILTPTDTKNPPILKWSSDPNALYLICMIDPDMPNPSKPRLKEFQHWVVGNIPGDDVPTGDVLTAYIGPVPPQDGGIHRYIFLVYRQNKELGFEEQIIMKSEGAARARFNVGLFARRHQLGEPIAVNFFRAQYDSQVNIEMKSFSDSIYSESTDIDQVTFKHVKRQDKSVSQN